MKISLSLGGSLLTGKTTKPYVKLDPETYRRYAEALKELHNQGHEIMVVCGGGKPARHFIEVSRQLGGSRDVQDLLGVKATHVNALLMMSALGIHADQNRIYQRGSDIRHAQKGRILVGGGYRPGSSTDYRAVIFAEKMGADLIINATDVPGVYDRNPEKHLDAVKLGELTFDQLEMIIKENTKQAPGEYGLFDLKAVRLARRTGIPVVFIDGTDPEEIKRAVDGTHSGSVVKG
jgi:uridylate kinase